MKTSTYPKATPEKKLFELEITLIVRIEHTRRRCSSVAAVHPEIAVGVNHNFCPIACSWEARIVIRGGIVAWGVLGAISGHPLPLIVDVLPQGVG